MECWGHSEGGLIPFKYSSYMECLGHSEGGLIPFKYRNVIWNVGVTVREG